MKTSILDPCPRIVTYPVLILAAVRETKEKGFVVLWTRTPKARLVQDRVLILPPRQASKWLKKIREVVMGLPIPFQIETQGVAAVVVVVVVVVFEVDTKKPDQRERK